MGFRRQEEQYRLDFAGTKLDGLVVVMRSVDVGQLLDFAELAEAGKNLTAENVGKIREVFTAVAENIISWNYEDANGNPQPTTYAGVKTLSLSEAIELLTAWVNALANVAPPLPKPSSVGSTYPVVSVPMEPLSPSRAS